MKIDIKQITEGDDSVTVRYKELNPTINGILRVLRSEDKKIWGKNESGNVCIGLEDIIYIESVDDRVFAYTAEEVVKIDGSLNSFMNDNESDTFFRCSKSIVINVNRVRSLKSLSSNRIDATMESGEHIGISRRYSSEFRRFLKGGC